MSKRVPTVADATHALDRCASTSLETACHLMLPAGESVGGSAHLCSTEFRWRGFAAELVGELQPDMRAARSVVLAGYGSADVFYDLSDDEYTWLSLVPSGSGSVLVGVEHVLGLPRMYFDHAATERAQASKSFLSRTILAASTGQTPALVSHAPHPTWLTLTPLGLQVVTSPGVPEYNQADTLNAATTLFGEVAKLRLGWGGEEATTTLLPDSVPGVYAAHVQTPRGCATVLAGAAFKQVLSDCHS